MPAKKHHSDDAAGPASEEVEAGHEHSAGQPTPDDQTESDGEKQARDVERGFDHALNRIPG